MFLGGTDPRDAAIAASDEEFAATVDAIKLLLGYSAARLLDESFLYSAAKHGLTTVRVDTSKMSIKTDDDEFPLHNGGLLVYPHGPAGPRAPGRPEASHQHVASFAGPGSGYRDNDHHAIR